MLVDSAAHIFGDPVARYFILGVSQSHTALSRLSGHQNDLIPLIIGLYRHHEFNTVVPAISCHQRDLLLGSGGMHSPRPCHLCGTAPRGAPYSRNLGPFAPSAEAPLPPDSTDIPSGTHPTVNICDMLVRRPGRHSGARQDVEGAQQ